MGKRDALIPIEDLELTIHEGFPDDQTLVGTRGDYKSLAAPSENSPLASARMEISMRKVVSVIIPFTRVETIGNAIQSVLRARFSNGVD